MPLRSIRFPRQPLPKSLKTRVRIAEAAEAAALASPTKSDPNSPLRRILAAEKNGIWNKSYRIVRTPSGELPVYTDVKNDGRCYTVIRKVQGNVPDLRRDVELFLKAVHQDPLRLPPKCAIRQTNQHLVLRGRWVDEVKSWMEIKGW